MTASRPGSKSLIPFRKGSHHAALGPHFLIIALLAGALGLGGLEGTAMYIARILLIIFVVLLVVSLVTGRRPPID